MPRPALPTLFPALTRRSLRIWRQYGVFWLGAIAVGLIAVLYARLIDWGYETFRTMRAHAVWLPLVLTPAIAAASVWTTRRFFRGAEGSGIPQVIATLHAQPSAFGSRLLTLRILFGKILISFLGILGGFTIGREGPTVQVGAALMFNLRRLYPRSNAQIERQLVLAGAAAGLSAAFNTPLAGIVFAIEELTRSFSARASGVLITAIILAGVVALGLNGNYTYFGTIDVGAHFPKLLAVAVLVTAIVTGIAGGLFSWLLLNTARWLPERLLGLYRGRPVAFAALCGFVIAVVGLVSGGTTFGSGYAEARGLLDGHEQLSVFYPFMKMVSMVASYLPGIPGGIFAPSLSIGAGFGNLLHLVFGNMPLPLLIALAMVGYLAAVTQSPITSFVIVMEMINGHALVISLMATALVSSRVARFFAPPLYETLAERYLAPPAPVAAQPAPTAAAATDVVAAHDAGAAPADPLDTLRDEDDGGGEAGNRAESDATPAGAAPQRAEADTAAAADAARNGPRDTQ
ncbi:chloride channel protein [Burkholderia multivorans]|uniref:chloride channel protein n=1 Tax=Burkholderia multivorans TaxID=87883 RepID=UPI001C27CA2D|nr:chloride channel protein [Burkholderia multivorans]MBU9572271.1 chloride channel protein [Burkholderia multivorans]MCO1462133.1 chloride channel protein [Burkholderia multivorans]UQN68582.1 chloride channel protein [Burkholderia multivorans]UQN74309.1 chloride channel protein [Burkholderia multivorans]